MFMLPNFINVLVQDLENMFNYCRQLNVLSNHFLNMRDAWKTLSGQWLYIHSFPSVTYSDKRYKDVIRHVRGLNGLSSRVNFVILKNRDKMTKDTEYAAPGG